MSVIGLFILLAFPFTILWNVALACKIMSARGTRPRYVASTVERALRWPTLLVRMLFVGIDLRMHLWGDLAWDVIALAVTVWAIAYVTGDEDDFWTGKGKRLSKRLRSTLSPRSPAYAGGAA